VPETSPNPTTPPTQPPSLPSLPPIDPKALLATAIAVVKNPTEFFRSIKGETGFAKCLVFSVAAAAVYGVLVFLSTIIYVSVLAGFGFAIVAAIQGLILAVLVGGLIGPFLGGLIVWGVSVIFGSKAPYEPSVRIAAYSMAVMPVMGVASFIAPVWILYFLVALAISAYAIYIAVMGAKVLNFDAPAAPTTTA
jgi:hypothetical protein